jgi:hypothetical protein
MKTDNAVNLLWSGGWDSTFRLLELILVRRRPVKPYYVIDSQRMSTGVELERRDRIKDCCLRGSRDKSRLYQLVLRIRCISEVI